MAATYEAFLQFADKKLKKLTLMNCHQVESIPLELIEATVKKVDHFVLKSTEITIDQKMVILIGACNMKCLEIEGVDLSDFGLLSLGNFFYSEVDPGPSLSCGLEKITLKDCNLSALHVFGILRKIYFAGAKSTLKSVTLEYHDDDEDNSYIDEVLLSNARRFAAVRLIKKENPLDLKEKGNAAYKAGNFPLALSKYKEAVKFAETRQEEVTALKNRAAVHLKLENYKAAVSDSSRALDILPGDVKALYRRCRAYESLGEIELAVEDARRARNINPRDRDIAETFNRLLNINHSAM